MVRDSQRKLMGRTEVTYVVIVRGCLPSDLNDRIARLHAVAILKSAPVDGCVLGVKSTRIDMKRA